MKPRGSAHFLAEFAASVGVPYGFERSVKVDERGLAGGRALITFHRDDLQRAGGWRAIASLLSKCELDARFYRDLSTAFARAELIHFGLEGAMPLVTQEPWARPSASDSSGSPPVTKIYFESPAVEDSDGLWWDPNWPHRGPWPLYLAYKWQAGAAPIVSHYGFYPAHSAFRVPEVVRRSQAGLSQPMRDAIHDLLDVCDIPGDRLPEHLLTVTEPANSRQSVVVNVYSSGLALGECAATLQTLLGALAPTSDAQFKQWLTSNHHCQLGHISWGCGRENEPFVGCYYGVREMAAGSSFLD